MELNKTHTPQKPFLLSPAPGGPSPPAQEANRGTIELWVSTMRKNTVCIVTREAAAAAAVAAVAAAAAAAVC